MLWTPRPPPDFSRPSAKGNRKERGNPKFRGAERGREREDKEKEEQRGGNRPAGERKRWAVLAKEAGLPLKWGN